MNPLETIDQLAARARGETVSIDSVADKVILRICGARRPYRRIIPLSMFAAASAVAAAVILAVGVHFWNQDPDPLWGMIAPLQEVPLW